MLTASDGVDAVGCLIGQLNSQHPPRARTQAHMEKREAETHRAPPSSRCTICCDRCHIQRPWDASLITRSRVTGWDEERCEEGFKSE